MRIVGVGLANLDLLGVLPAYPARNRKNRLTAPPLDPATIDTDILDDAAVLVIDGRQPAAQALAARRARTHATIVLLDAERLDDDTRDLLP